MLYQLYSKTALILITNTAVQSQDEETPRIFFPNSCCGRRYRWSDLCDLLWHTRDPIGRYDNPVLVKSMSKWRDVRCHRESVHLRLPDWLFWNELWRTDVPWWSISDGPCLNGGVCENFGSQNACSCPTGYSGNNCEVTWCSETLQCNNGGSCSTDGVEYVCICPIGLSGKRVM